MGSVSKASSLAGGKTIDDTLAMNNGVSTSCVDATRAALSQSKNLDLSGFDDHDKS